MRSHNALAEILNLNNSNQREERRSSSVERRSSGVSRVTEEFNHGELEAVLSKPAGPVRIPEVQISKNRKNVSMLQEVMAAQGALHERAALSASRAKMLIPLACGIGFGITFASFVILILL